MHPLIREFYEHTSRFKLSIVPEWRTWMKPPYELFKRVVAEPLGQAAIPSNIEEAQRGMVSTIDTISLDDGEEIDIRGWIRTFADTGKPIYVGIYTTLPPRGPRLRQRRLPDPELELHRHAAAAQRRRRRAPADLEVRPRVPRALPERGQDGEFTVLKLLAFQERIHVHVDDGELKTEHSFSLAGQRFLTLHYEIARL